MQFESNPVVMCKLIKSFLWLALGLKEHFNSWFAVTVMHLWMYNTRLKVEGADGKEMIQEMFEQLWYNIKCWLFIKGWMLR